MAKAFPMLDLARWALIAVVSLGGLCFSPAFAASEGADKETDLKEAAKEFNSGRSLYRAGQIKEGFEKMEAAIIDLQRLDDEHGFREPLPENATKKDKQAWGFAVVLGSISMFRVRLLDKQMTHGCYRKAAVLLENDLKHWPIIMPDITTNPDHIVSMGRIYYQRLIQLLKAREELGEYDQAIAVQIQIIDYLQNWIDADIWQWPDSSSSEKARHYHASAMLTLASLHEEAGKPEEAQRYVAEARRLYDDIWRRRPPEESGRRAEARLLAAEGRHEAAKAVHEEIIAAEVQGQEHNRSRLDWLYLGLAAEHRALGDAEAEKQAIEDAVRYRKEIIAAELRKEPLDKTNLAEAYSVLSYIYRESGDVEAELSALESAHRYHTEARRQDFTSMVQSAHRLAMALRKVGRTETANALRDKYQLCFD